MSFGGRVGAASDLQMKKYALDYLVSNKSRVNHENNRIYIHDLEFNKTNLKLHFKYLFIYLKSI